MIFTDYYKMWFKYGMSLQSGIVITEDILALAKGQNGVCDLIWAINAANQVDKSAVNLSDTVMDQVRNTFNLILNHDSFKRSKNNYTNYADVRKKAEDHFKQDPGFEPGFIKRQKTIIAALKTYKNDISCEIGYSSSMLRAVSKEELPTREEVLKSLRGIAPKGKEIDEDVLKSAVEFAFAQEGRTLKPNWWEIIKCEL